MTGFGGARSVFWVTVFALTIILVPFVFYHFTGGVAPFFEVLHRLPVGVVISSVLLTVVFYALDYARFYCLARVLGYRISIVTGVQLTCISYFVSSLTPTAELHLPAMVMVLVTLGIPMAKAVAITISKSMIMTFWVCAIALLLAVLDPDLIMPADYADALPLYLLPLAVLSALLMLIILFPRRVERLGSRWFGKKATGIRVAIIKGSVKCATSLAEIGQSASHFHWLAHLASIAFVIVYALIGGVLASGVGKELGLFHGLSVFSNSLMVSYIAPVPGSMGVTEVFTAYLLDRDIGVDAMSISILLRFLCWYVVAIPGLFITLYWIRSKAPGTRRNPLKSGA